MVPIAANNGGGAGEKFLIALFVSWVTSGTIYSMIYVGLMRAFRRDPNAVEEWFERWRLRLESTPVPVLEFSIPVLRTALFGVYGDNPLGWLRTSFIIGILVTSAMFACFYSEYRTVSPATRALKNSLEEQANPIIYKYRHDPALAAEYEKAWEEHSVPIGPDASESVYDFRGYPFDDIRKGHETYEQDVFALMAKVPKRRQLMALWLFEGDTEFPGFHLLHSVLLFIFNLLIDVLTVSLIGGMLIWLSQKISVKNALITLGSATCGTVVAMSISFLAYWCFFNGDTGIFWQAMVVIPLALVTFGLASVVFYVVITAAPPILKEDKGAIFLIIFPASILLTLICIGVACIRYNLGFWRSLPFGDFSVRQLLSFPYSMAAITAVPASICLMAFFLVLCLKILVEPTRVLSWLYMTVIKLQSGSTQAYGICVFLGMVTGVICGMVWAST